MCHDDKFIDCLSGHGSYIKNLTGITPYDVKDACEMKEALEMFIDWIPDDAECVSWSKTDEKQIRHEIEAKGICIPKLNKLLDEWKDCQRVFAEKMGNTRQYRLSEALVAADIMYDENAHDGLVDARNTAQLFVKMEKEPVLKPNEYYNRGREEVQRTTFMLGDMFASLGVAFA